MDDSKHKYYKQIGEMWHILATLELIGKEDSLFILMHNKWWDEWLVEWLEMPLVFPDSQAYVILLQQIFNALKLPLTPRSIQELDNHGLALGTTPF